MRIFKAKELNMYSRIIVSFILMLFIPLISTMTMYQIAYSELEAEVTHSSTSTVKQFAHTFDEKLESVYSTISGISNNSAMQALALSDSLSQPLDNFDIYQFKNTLKAINNSNVSEFLIYFGNTDRVLSPLYSYLSPENYETAYYGDTDSLRNNLESASYNEILSLRPFEINPGKYTIAVYQPLAISSYKLNKTTICAVLDEAMISSMLETYADSSRGTMMILKKDGTVLMSSDDNFAFENDADFPYSEGIYDCEYNGENHIIIAAQSLSSEDIIYTLSVPKNIYMEKLSGFRILSFINIITFIILGFAAVILLTKVNYKPVKEMITTVSNITNKDYNKNINEASFISDAISETHNENIKISRELEIQSSVNATIYLQRLLHGIQPYTSNIIEDFHQRGIEIISDAFVVAIFSIDGWDNSIIDDIYEGQNVTLVETIVQNVFEEMVNENYRGTVIYTDKDLFSCVINVERPDSSASESIIIDDICKICRRAMMFIEDKMGIYCTVSVSNVRFGYAGLREADINASRALQYRLVRGDRKVISYSSIVEKPFSANEQFYQNAKNELINYIKTSTPSCFEVYSHIYDEYMGDNVISPEVMYSFVSALNTVIAEVYSYLGSSIDNNSTFVIVRHGDTPDKISKQFCYIFFLFNTEYAQQHTEEHLSDKIRRYIDENHTDPGLGVNSVGYKFDLSPSYCSKIFKKENGISITDYILEARMQGARELLIGSDKSVDEVAESLGFSSSSVFIRQFKKSCGMTPGSYRRAYGK